MILFARFALAALAGVAAIAFTVLILTGDTSQPAGGDRSVFLAPAFISLAAYGVMFVAAAILRRPMATALFALGGAVATATGLWALFSLGVTAPTGPGGVGGNEIFVGSIAASVIALFGWGLTRRHGRAVDHLAPANDISFERSASNESADNHDFTPTPPRPQTEGKRYMTEQLKTITDHQCKSGPAKYDDLSVLMLNCTLTRSPNLSHTEGLMKIAEQIYKANGVKTEILRPVDYDIAAGLGLDYAGVDGYAKDDWPMIQKKIDACDILLIGTSVWLGEKSSVCNRVLERMYGYTHLLNERGQYRDYGKTGAVLITGNEDGVKHCAMNVLFSLSHIGYVVPPQADAGWMGEAGPGPSYMDPGSGGPENDFTNRNTTFLVWNTLHVARWLKDNGGFPAHGNQPEVWDAGCKTDFHSPEHRR